MNLKMEFESPKINFYKQLPKLELHAHLNGSLSASALEKLGSSKTDILRFQKLTESNASQKTLEECFSLFQIAHNATKDKNSVYNATKYVIEDFYLDNVIYLELRTTPREEQNMTKCEYIESVVKGIQDSNKNIITKLLLSIDRKHDSTTSKESMKLIIQMKEKYPEIIKGVDFSGNPNVGCFDRKLFQQAVDNGLNITLHCGEIKNNKEVLEIINFEPQRIGHGTFLHPRNGGSKEGWNTYCKKNILLECCLTSNILCGTVGKYQEHHLDEWIKNSLPYCLCTDDKGIFGTSLSTEYALAAQTFNLSNEDLWTMNLNAINYTFASTEEKNKLKKILNEWKMKNF